MNCREFVDFLMRYLDGQLDAAALEIFEEHMRECPPCEVYLDTYRETIRLGKYVCEPDGSTPEDVPEELVQAILSARKAG